MTFEEAKLAVAEKHGGEIPNSWDKLIAQHGILSQIGFIKEAAMLWQQDNIELISDQLEMLEQAEQIIQTLMEYGNLKPVGGIIYGGATHSHYLKEASQWLFNQRKSKKTRVSKNKKT